MFPLKSKLKLNGIASRETRRTDETTNTMSIAGGGSQCSSPRSQLDAAMDQTAAADPLPSKYLAISVLEARNLVAKDYDTHISDPFVKITLGTMSKKTRVIFRNCHPMWEQKLVFPVDGLSEAEPLRIEMFDKDFNSKEFLGQVMMTLGKALEIEADAAQRSSYWLVLSKQRSTDLVNGELCLGFEMMYMDQQQHSQLAADLEDQLSSESLASHLTTKALHIQLKGLNGLINSGLFGPKPEQPGHQHHPPKLSLYIKYGRIHLEKQLPPPTAPSSHVPELEPGSPRSCPDAYEVIVNEEVIVPLGPAVRASPLKARKRDELVDIKVYLKSEDTLIAKTQIPISSVPILSSIGPSAIAAMQTEETMASGAATPRTTQDGTHKGLGGLECMSMASHSMPGTPRGTAVDLVQGGCAPVTPNSTGGALVEQSSFSLSAHIHKRFNKLGGWVGSSSNLSANSSSPPESLSSTLTPPADSTTSALNSLASTMMLQGRSESPNSSHAVGKGAHAVEGSLDSVTAYLSARGHHVHAPAGLSGKRVQGLAEMHDAPANVLRKPLKAIFVPPREVNRLGWVPSKATGDDDEENTGSPSPRSSSRPFCRIMDPKVPTNPGSSLEVTLALAVVEHRAGAGCLTTAPSLAAGAGQHLLEDSSSEDDEEAAQATPIEPGPALELLIQEATLQGIGSKQLYKLVIDASSELMKAHNAANDVTEMVIGPWQAAPAGVSYQRVRNVSYTKKLNIPLPLAPDKCHVWEEHRLMVKEDGGWVVLLICKNDAPKGDCFEAHVQICGVYVNSNTSKLRVSMELNWTKKTWGQGMVQNGAATDAKRSYAALVKRLNQHAAGCCRGSSAGTEVLVEHQPAAMVGAAVDAQVAAGKGGWGLQGKMQMLLRVALVLALLLLAWAVVTAGRGISTELHQLTAAMKECKMG